MDPFTGIFAVLVLLAFDGIVFVAFIVALVNYLNKRAKIRRGELEEGDSLVSFLIMIILGLAIPAVILVGGELISLSIEPIF